MSETATKTEKIYGTFLKDSIVKVKAVESQGKWSTLLVKGEEKRKDPYIYGKVKRSFQVPLQNVNLGGGVKPILNDISRVLIQKYELKYPGGMTQKEFFEEELGVDLTTTNSEETNFWRKSKLGRVLITKDGITLNLNLPLDMLKYLILMSDTTRIAPSYDDRLLKATYEFMIVDESKVISQKMNEASMKADAYIKFAEITRTAAATIGFIKALGRTVPQSATSDWLKGEVFAEVESDPKKFLDIVNHPQYEKRIFVQEAVDAGSILRKAKDRYTLDNGVELGDLTSVINFLNDPENQSVLLRIKGQIELKNK